MRLWPLFLNSPVVLASMILASFSWGLQNGTHQILPLHLHLLAGFCKEELSQLSFSFLLSCFFFFFFTVDSDSFYSINYSPLFFLIVMFSWSRPMEVISDQLLCHSAMSPLFCFCSPSKYVLEITPYHFLESIPLLFIALPYSRYCVNISEFIQPVPCRCTLRSLPVFCW